MSLKIILRITQIFCKKIETCTKTEDLKIHSIGEADKIPKRPEKSVSNYQKMRNEK